MLNSHLLINDYKDKREVLTHHFMNAEQSFPSRTIVHAKLEMTEPGDHDEQEAETVANTIAAGGKISRKISGGSGTSGISVSNQMESQLNHLRGGGQAMPTDLRNMMESGFGQDFSHVRLHTDSEAASLSSSIHAKAFTHGNDIYFNQGQFSPNTSEGQKLMAHELTHVVQGGEKIGRDPLFPNYNNLQFNYYDPQLMLALYPFLLSPYFNTISPFINSTSFFQFFNPSIFPLPNHSPLQDFMDFFKNHYVDGKLKFDFLELGKSNFPFKSAKDYNPTDNFNKIFPPKAKDYDLYYLQFELCKSLGLFGGLLGNPLNSDGVAGGISINF